jgi:S1-C subfamily serine protease
LRDGDEILAVNGRAASKWDEFLLADTLIGEPGKLVSVRYRRGSTIDSVQFRLEEIL